MVSSADPDRPLPPADLDDLVRRSREGDMDAFGCLVERYHAEVARLAYRLLRSREAAEDATQEIFLKAWQHMGRFRASSRFSTWLYSIASHHCMDLIRARQREASLLGRFVATLRPRTTTPADLPPEVPGDWEARIRLREALAELPEPSRHVVTLHLYMGYSFQEIATMLGEPLQTVRSRVYAAMDRLRKRLADLDP
jgi:RNA polymerase sigma-70 factor, ECF subfamily